MMTRLTDEQRDAAEKFVPLMRLNVGRVLRTCRDTRNHMDRFRDAAIDRATTGLMSAAAMHDPAKAKLSTYMYQWLNPRWMYGDTLHRTKMTTAVGRRFKVPAKAFDPADEDQLAVDHRDFRDIEAGESFERLVRMVPHARDREILRMRFEQGMNGPEIAAVVGIGREAVRKVIERSLAKIKSQLEREPDHAERNQAG